MEQRDELREKNSVGLKKVFMVSAAEIEDVKIKLF
jgi:hypothetical protein